MSAGATDEAGAAAADQEERGAADGAKVVRVCDLVEQQRERSARSQDVLNYTHE